LQAAYRAHLEEHPDTEWLDQDDTEFDRENAEQVHVALRRLPAVQREVLTLFFLEDLAIEEIADVVGIPPGTVKSRLFHAKRALRKILEEESARHE
jgi:RNA polymerase sigma-70 factor (ECF subfamily)